MCKQLFMLKLSILGAHRASTWYEFIFHFIDKMMNGKVKYLQAKIGESIRLFSSYIVRYVPVYAYNISTFRNFKIFEQIIVERKLRTIVFWYIFFCSMLTRYSNSISVDENDDTSCEGAFAVWFSEDNFFFFKGEKYWIDTRNRLP